MIETVTELLKAPMTVLGAGGVLIGAGILLSGIRPRRDTGPEDKR